MNAKQLVEYVADLRLDVPGSKLAMLVAVEGFESAEIERLRAEVEALRDFVEELAQHDSHSTEYDGRMIVLCPDCGGQDGAHTTGCVFVRAKAHIDAARTEQGLTNPK